mmetsp:Transcript_106144/g.274534  ORF Transcript_106144/g.274534 Transcript_106144/m.274534 type:complete len:240 (-) Transcript_106144:158-877(-)
MFSTASPTSLRPGRRTTQAAARCRSARCRPPWRKFWGSPLLQPGSRQRPGACSPRRFSSSSSSSSTSCLFQARSQPQAKEAPSSPSPPSRSSWTSSAEPSRAWSARNPSFSGRRWITRTSRPSSRATPTPPRACRCACSSAPHRRSASMSSASTRSSSRGGWRASCGPPWRTGHGTRGPHAWTSDRSRLRTSRVSSAQRSGRRKGAGVVRSSLWSSRCGGRLDLAPWRWRICANCTRTS